MYFSLCPFNNPTKHSLSCLTLTQATVQPTTHGFGNIGRVKRGGFFRDLAGPRKFIGQKGLRQYRINKHLQGQVFLKVLAQEKVNKLFSQRALLSAFHDASELNLTPTGMLCHDGSRRRFIKFNFSINEFRDRTGSIRHNQRLRPPLPDEPEKLL